MKLPVALQLFSVRDAFQADPVGTLEKVKDAGYVGVEFAGLFDNDPAWLREQLDRIGLRAISAHVPYAQMMEDADKVIRDYKILGCDFVVIPWLDRKNFLTEETLPSTIESVRVLGKKFREAGLTLLYHNHDFEFRKIGDEYILDLIYAGVSPDDLKTEIDTCWVKVGGEDPADYVRKYTGRSPVVHLKDFVGGGKEGLYELIGNKEVKVDKNNADFDFRPVGHGVQNFPPILEAAVEAGAAWVVVEQDRSTQRDPLEAVKMSRDYLKTLGW